MWSSSNNRKIQRVPGVLVMEDEKKKENDYYPKVVSIGPYHHGKPELAQVEAFKPMAVELLVRNPEEKESFYQQVMGMIREVRNCYEEESVAIYSDAYLARMMLQDASLIIINMVLNVDLVETIFYAVERYRVRNAMIEHLGRLTIATLFHDFILVENQVPLCVMQLLIRLRYGERTEREMIYRYVNTRLFGEDREIVIYAPLPLHLLEVIHRVLVSDCVQPPEDTTSNRCVIRLFPSRNEATENWATKLTHSFRTVTDLKAKGIRFRPSSTQSLKDVGFNSGFFSATLRLPSWFVSPYTKPFFKNLVAYELLPGVPTEPTVTAYVDLMQSLVERPEDVKELRERRILHHQLGSDEEVLNVYKSINTHGASDYYLFLPVKNRIQAHYNSTTKTWLAELIHTYFRSPWTVIAFLAATAVIALTAAQLHYALPTS